VHKATRGFGNPKVRVPMDKSQERKSQTMDSSSERCLSDLHNKNSNLKMELA